MFGDRGREGDDVVLGDFFDGFDARDIEGAALANVSRRIGRYDAGPRHGFCCGDFNLQPGLVLALVAPDATHFRVGVPPDHRSRNPPLTECQPFSRDLQAVDRTKHSGGQRSIGEQIARDALDVVSRHAFDAL